MRVSMRARVHRRRGVGLAAAPLLLVVLLVSAAACAAKSRESPSGQWHQTVLAANLDVPRAIALAPNGDVYVADSGATNAPGTGRVVRYTPRGQIETVLAGVSNERASLHGQTFAYGLSGVAVRGESVFVTVGAGAFVPAPFVGPNRLIRLAPDGSHRVLFEHGRFEDAQNPDQAEVDSNAAGVVADEDGTIWTADSSGNWVVRLSPDGVVLATGVFPRIAGASAIPVGLALGPDRNVYVTLFRCAEPTLGKGGIARVQADGSHDILVAGLNNPIAVAFDGMGVMYVLEFGVDYRRGTGRLLRFDKDTRQVLLDGLEFPTSLAVDPSGSLYITTIASPAGDRPGTGRLLRFDAR